MQHSFRGLWFRGSCYVLFSGAGNKIRSWPRLLECGREFLVFGNLSSEAKL